MYKNIFEVAVKASDVSLAFEYMNEGVCDYNSIIDAINHVKIVEQELNDWELNHHH